MFKVIRSDRTKIEIWQIFNLYVEKKQLKMSFDRHFIAPGVAQSNSDVRILTGSSQIADFAHAQYRFGQKHSERLARRQDAIATFLVFYF